MARYVLWKKVALPAALNLWIRILKYNVWASFEREAHFVCSLWFVVFGCSGTDCQWTITSLPFSLVASLPCSLVAFSLSLRPKFFTLTFVFRLSRHNGVLKRNRVQITGCRATVCCSEWSQPHMLHNKPLYHATRVWEGHVVIQQARILAWERRRMLSRSKAAVRSS